MKLTIVTNDKATYVDGKARNDVDISDVDPTIHAIQWDGTRGEIEYKTVVCSHCGGVSRKPNEVIKDISPYLKYAEAHGRAQKIDDDNEKALKAKELKEKNNAP